VVYAGILVSLLVTGLILAVGAMDRSAQTDQELQSLNAGAVSATREQLSESSANPGLEPECTAEDRMTLPARIPPDRAIAPPLAVADHARDRASSRPARESYGTAIEFLSRPAEAARQSLHENKLLYLLQVSGNFEDAKFT
jgi:hypothetical protein